MPVWWRMFKNWESICACVCFYFIFTGPFKESSNRTDYYHFKVLCIEVWMHVKHQNRHWYGRDSLELGKRIWEKDGIRPPKIEDRNREKNREEKFWTVKWMNMETTKVYHQYECTYKNNHHFFSFKQWLLMKETCPHHLGMYFRCHKVAQVVLLNQKLATSCPYKLSSHPSTS